jgi:hypothetical protein
VNAAPRSRPRRRLRAAPALAAAALVGAAALAVGASPATADPVGWTMSWSAPVTTAGPNRFAAPAELTGTAKFALGSTNRVSYQVTPPDGLPAACGTFPKDANAVLRGTAFTIEPALRCNGTYVVVATGHSGSGVLASKSSGLRAPVSLADPGAPPTGLRGAVDGAAGVVTISWNPVDDPDVVGYRVRRDGAPVFDAAKGATAHTDTAPGAGTYQYDVQTLRWGDGGPGSKPIASPGSTALTARVDPKAPPGPVGPAGGGSGSGPAAGPAATIPKGPAASATIPRSTARPKKTYRSGGSISTGTPTTVDTGFDEDLPYQSREGAKQVELAGPDGTRTVSRTVSTPTKTSPGLLVPLAVVLVLVAASLQIRAFLRRTAPASISVDGGMGPDPA